ncbi:MULTISPECIES: type II secretion system protein [unclassified Vibrio]|uniref:type II secretion system protein n=1 Tax=unclassified Vibrio TaxID=2614977 RepID=UPI0014836AD7|nr:MULTISPECIES: type II secretion system protein [unclassified Vibrio]NNN44617.1 type II secretion system protein [Vibrio sp. 1-1(7)]NNN73133.1 type II secretion system protein [Vibrio sp. 12-2(3-a)]
MKKQGGFTLIELVVVIVILGILAVTAAPRFINLQDDARDATLKGLQGAIQGASGMVYGKAAIKGLESAVSGSVKSGAGEDVDIVYGYPAASSTAIAAIVQGIGDDGDFKFIKGPVGTPPAVTFGIENYTTQCVKYTQAENATTPAKVEISKEETDCKK